MVIVATMCLNGKSRFLQIKILMIWFDCPLCMLMNIMHRSRDRHRFCDSMVSLKFNY
jgi:hypothetical protein